MLDTVKLSIPIENCKINSPNIFTPSIKPIIKKGVKYICNIDKDYLSVKKYFPKLTIFRGYDKRNYLIIEFSAPKLLLLNNFEELVEENFLEVLNTLQERLNGLDIEIDIDVLKNAKIYAIHYSKNFILGNASVSSIINLIGKLEVSKRIDIARTDYKNQGQIIRFHTNSYELAFYDKIADLKQSIISDKRAFESDNKIQQCLLEKIQKLEVLRMEVRLNKKYKIKQILEKTDIKVSSLTFKELFNKEISQKILLHFWQEYIDKSIYIVCQSNNETDLILSKCHLAGLNQTKSFKLLGFLKCINDTSCRYAKEFYNNSGFFRLKSDVELLNLEDNYFLKQFKKIKNDIQTMLPIKLSYEN